VDERGFSLVETLVVAAIAALLAGLAIELGAGAHPAAAHTAAVQFDAALDYGRSLAVSQSGATVILTASAINVYCGRPDTSGSLKPAAVAPFAIGGVRVSESTLGAAPIAVFLNSEGQAAVAAFTGGSTPAPMSTEPPCPPSGGWTIRFDDSRTVQSRRLECGAPVAGP
jgi:prepilin-type N-terminal cleavage/methylation domain-containing protein